MKKLKLSSLELEGVEVLNRDQLIRIVGGDDDPYDSPCYNNCTRFCCDKGNGVYQAGICDGVGHSYCCEPGSPTYWC